ncbi:MAG: hypothetical protein U1E65_00140 [Myxococcota bacterium]
MTEAALDGLFEGLTAAGSGAISLADVLGMKRQVLDVLLDKAIGLANFGKLEQAENELDRLHQVDGRSPLPAFALGAVRAERKNFEGALEAYREAERRAEALAWSAMVGKVALCLGHAHLALGERAEAELALARAEARGEPAVQETARAMLRAIEGST